MIVQNRAAKRGRPRDYEPDTALAQAMAAFWDAGYAATTLDAISSGTGMNRPSLYAAFGDKRALYGRALDRYRAHTRTALAEALAPDLPLREALRRVYEHALSLYFSGEHGARGCFLIGTALTESVLNTAARTTLRDALREIDAAFEARIRLATAHGELPPDTDPPGLAKLVSAVLHTLAIRSRAGEQRAVLETIVESALDLICRPRIAPSRMA
jgi:AcrR family transcriptional regulator